MQFQKGQILYSFLNNKFRTHTILEATETQYVLDGCVRNITTFSRLYIEYGTSSRGVHESVFYISKLIALHDFKSKVRKQLDRKRISNKRELEILSETISLDIDTYRENYFNKKIEWKQEL